MKPVVPHFFLPRLKSKHGLPRRRLVRGGRRGSPPRPDPIDARLRRTPSPASTSHRPPPPAPASPAVAAAPEDSSTRTKHADADGCQRHRPHRRARLPRPRTTLRCVVVVVEPRPRNPRRTSSQRISPPQLARSDSTLFTPSTGVIDLTADSPEESRPSDSTRGRASRPHHHPHHHHHHHRPPNRNPQFSRDPRNPDELIDFQFLSGTPVQGGPSFTIGLTRRFANIFDGGITFNHMNLPPHLDITRTAFIPARAPSPKPPLEPAPPTRDGFTRDTCADPEKAEENVVICPACEEELAYDPTDTAPAHSTPSKKRKRAAGEHHFWALKKCGHVRAIRQTFFFCFLLMAFLGLLRRLFRQPPSHKGKPPRRRLSDSGWKGPGQRYQ